MADVRHVCSTCPRCGAAHATRDVPASTVERNVADLELETTTCATCGQPFAEWHYVVDIAEGRDVSTLIVCRARLHEVPQFQAVPT